MLNAMRNSVGSIGAKILLGLLVIAFAAWGLEGVFAARTQTVAAKVGDAEISTQEFARMFDGRLQALRASTGSGLTPEDARRSGFDMIVLDQMATQTALSEEAKALGIDASDQAISKAIMEFPQFQDAYGKFDRTAYDASLRQSRLRQNEFEENIRHDLARDVLLQSIGNGTTAPRSLAETLYKYRNEKRTLEYIELEPDDVEDPGDPSDTQLEDFHKENAAQFTAPEYRKISFVALTVKDVAAGLERSEQDLRVEYNLRLASYTTPERRNIEQMVFDTQDEADEAAQKIADGESFAQIAEARGLSAQDVSLGFQSKADLPEALAEAAFAANETGIIDPVDTALGWSLLNIRSIAPEKVVTFEDAKDALKTELTTTEARQIVPERSVDLDDQLAGGSTLEEAAEQSGAVFVQLDAVDETGRDPDGNRINSLPDDPEFLNWVFTANVGDEPTLLEGSTGDYFSLKIEEITEAALRPIDTITEEIKSAWVAAERKKALQDLTDRLTDRLSESSDLAAISEELGAEVKTAGPGIRTDRTMGLSAELLERLFAAQKDDAVTGDAAEGQSRLVGTVSDIIPATSEEDITAIDRSTESYAARLAQDFVDQFTRTARNNHPIQPNQAAIDAVFTAPHGGGYGGDHGGGLGF